MSLNENTILKPRTDFDDCYVYGDEIGKYVLFFFVVKISIFRTTNSSVIFPILMIKEIKLIVYYFMIFKISSC